MGQDSPAYRRILLKLSGEALLGSQDYGIDPPVIQRVAAEELCSSINEERFAVDLLDGVTGAGKTEVYFEAIAATLRAGRQVLVLLPEIALSAQWLGRFEARFGARPIAWHSELSAASRRDSWRAVSFGEAHLVVGARSALFLPFSKLGLIVKLLKTFCARVLISISSYVFSF